MWYIHPFSVLCFIDIFILPSNDFGDLHCKRDWFVNFPFLSFPWICWHQKEISNIFAFNYYWKKMWKINSIPESLESLVKTLRPTALCEEGLSRWFEVGIFTFHISCFCQFWQIMVLSLQLICWLLAWSFS
jgi:hypothetical protein